MTSPIERINALTQNAKSTWFALLSALLFVGVTLMGVEHIDFYGVDRATQLPLINVSVPTPLFFYGAPLLIAAIYSYFHLYLIRLWDALGAAPARHEGTRLGEAIAPWLVSDAALHLRARLRGDNCAAPRALESASMLLNILLAWVFGPFVLAWLWWASMPARTWEMTTIAGLCLLAALIAGGASLAMMVQRMRRELEEGYQSLWSGVPAMALMTGVIPLVLALGLQRTAGKAEYLAPLILTGENLVEKPANWLPEEIARKDFKATWCKREGIKPCRDLGATDSRFLAEWQSRHLLQIQSFRVPRWSKPNARKPNFRNAELTQAFLPNTDLNHADLSGARLQEAILSYSTLSESNMQGAVLYNTSLRNADMIETNLFDAKMLGTELSDAALIGSDLRKAQLIGSRLTNTNLNSAKLQGATFNSVLAQNLNFSGANFSGATLLFSLIDGREFTQVWMSQRLNKLISLSKEAPNFSGSTNVGGALRNLDLSDAVFSDSSNWETVFLDGSVTLPHSLETQRQNRCQWHAEVLPDAEFYGRWRGWIEAFDIVQDEWNDLAPTDWKTVPAISPPEGCSPPF